MINIFANVGLSILSIIGGRVLASILYNAINNFKYETMLEGVFKIL